MLKKVLAFTLLIALLAGCAAPIAAPAAAPAADAAAAPAAEAAAPAEGATELVLGSWRVDDVAQMEKILAAFTAENPGITVKFDPTNPPDYNTALRTQLEGGTGPDLMYLRSYATSRQLFADGFIEPLDAMHDDLVTAYGEANLVPWSTVEGQSYGVPIIAVSHGIYYNQKIFSDLGIEIPTTWEELIAAAQTIKDAGITPFANASGDAWTIAEIVFMNLAPNFIGGREGRLAYLSGERCFNDPHAVAAFQAVADIAPFLPEGQSALVYYDSQVLFETGQAAMWFGGSWDIPVFEKEIKDFDWSVFATPPPAGQPRYVTFHLDAGIGVNAASKHKDAAMTFLKWLDGQTFAKMLADELPGFFPIHLQAPEVANAHAAAFLALNKDAAGTDVRWAWDGLLDGTPDGYTLMQDNAIAILNGEMTPQAAADGLQAGLAEWLPAAQSCKQ